MTSKGIGGTAEAMVVMQRTYSAALEWEGRDRPYPRHFTGRRL